MEKQTTLNIEGSPGFKLSKISMNDQTKDAIALQHFTLEKPGSINVKSSQNSDISHPLKSNNNSQLNQSLRDSKVDPKKSFGSQPLNKA